MLCLSVLASVSHVFFLAFLNSHQVLRLFGHFLNHLANNATKGCAFLIEADRIETEQLDLRRRMALFDVDINNVKT